MHIRFPAPGAALKALPPLRLRMIATAAGAGVAACAASGMAGHAANWDAESPAVVTCPLFLELTGVNSQKYAAYRFWLEGLWTDRGASLDPDQEMAAIAAACRANPALTFAEVARRRPSVR